jgi:predicted DNA-binding transcriptional regulator AlpA
MLPAYQDLRMPVQDAQNFGEPSMPSQHAGNTSVAAKNASESAHRMTHEELLGAKDVAHWLGVSRAWVFEHSNGRRRPFLPSVKLGKSVRYRPADVSAFIIECERFSRKGAA